MIASSSGSLDPFALKKIAAPATPGYVPPAAATGERFARLSVTDTCAVPTLPAASVAVNVSVLSPATSGDMQLKPSAGTVVPLQVADATPDKASDAAPLSATGDVVSAAPATGVAMVTVGGVVSIFNVSVLVAVFPARSVTVPTICCPAPWVETALGG